MKLRGGLVIGLAAAFLGCGGPDVEKVTVIVQAPDRQGEVVPIEGAQLTILPFDIDSVYAALERKNQPGTAPATESVEKSYQAFYRADSGLVAAESLVVTRQAEVGTITDRTSPEYREAFAAFEEAEDRRDSLAQAKDSAEVRYAPARDGYNRARGTWEAAAWDGFGSIQEQSYGVVDAPRDSAGSELGFQHKTGEDGTFTLYLSPGTWWVAGRVPVPGSPHEVYRWNVPFRVPLEGSARVELTGENAKILYTY